MPESYDREAAPNATPFPSNHGLLTKSGAMLFPICLAPGATPDGKWSGKVLQVCALISKDTGRFVENGEAHARPAGAKLLEAGQDQHG